MKVYLTRIKSEIRKHLFYYILLSLILTLAFFIRVYRVSDLLQFYYDQGRDALVIWKLWHEGKPFLIGPVTGLAGIFLGPFYYYLIAPFYLLGDGDPSLPAIFISFTSVAALLVIYVLGTRMHSRTTGIIAAFIGAFSYGIFTLSRWLSNPTPMLLLSSLFLWCLWEITVLKQKTMNNKHSFGWLWITASLLVGIALQFESASAVFYIPILMVFAVWQRKKLPGMKYLIPAFLVFVMTLIPQIIFNFRHDNILLDNFFELLFGEKAFKGLTDFIFRERTKYFWGVYLGKIFTGPEHITIAAVTISFSILAGFYYKFGNQLKLFAIFFVVPMLGYLFFQGNYGNIYDYYTIGYFLPLILFFSLGMGELLKHKGGFIIVMWFLYHFSKLNYQLIKNYLAATPATRPIAIQDQKQAVKWIYEDSRKYKQFNIDVYVPPVIPYSYDYLFLWQFDNKCPDDMCGYLKDVPVSDLYTLYEADPPHPERLEVWLTRQKGIGKVIEEVQFGQITVQRRVRI